MADPDPHIPQTEGLQIGDQPQIEHIMWGRRSPWSALWWWTCFQRCWEVMSELAFRSVVTFEPLYHVRHPKMHKKKQKRSSPQWWSGRLTACSYYVRSEGGSIAEEDRANHEKIKSRNGQSSHYRRRCFALQTTEVDGRQSSTQVTPGITRIQLFGLLGLWGQSDLQPTMNHTRDLRALLEVLGQKPQYSWLPIESCRQQCAECPQDRDWSAHSSVLYC